MQNAIFPFSACFHCGSDTATGGKFCGECGNPFALAGYQSSHGAAGIHLQAGPYSDSRLFPSLQTEQELPAPPTEILPASYPGNPDRPVVPLNDRNVPIFAHVQAAVTPDISAELRKEAAKVMILLARERLFLYFHWLIFIGLNLLGCWLAIRCYQEFIGDEMTKSMIASTPFMFINSLALCCIVPIRGTRKEIARLKEQSQYIKFKMEFGHLM